MTVDDDVEVETAGFSLANMAFLQKHVLSAAGGMVVRQGDEPPYLALGFKTEKSVKHGSGYGHLPVLHRQRV